MINCKECHAELSFMNIKRLQDLDFSKIGMYCNDCFPTAEAQLQEQRFVEEYKGNKIYSKDGKYTPYWQSHYFFNSVEDTRTRIDNNHIAVVDPEVLRFMS